MHLLGGLLLALLLFGLQHDKAVLRFGALGEDGHVSQACVALLVSVLLGLLVLLPLALARRRAAAAVRLARTSRLVCDVLLELAARSVAAASRQPRDGAQPVEDVVLGAGLVGDGDAVAVVVVVLAQLSTQPQVVELHVDALR